MAHYAKRVKADTEITNAITEAKIKIQVKIAELNPRMAFDEAGRKGGRGNEKASSNMELAFHRREMAAYRQAEANKDKLEAYVASAKEKGEGPPKEITLGGFLRFATGTEKAGLAAHVSANTGIPEWYTPAEYLDAARIPGGAICWRVRGDGGEENGLGSCTVAPRGFDRLCGWPGGRLGGDRGLAGQFWRFLVMILLGTAGRLLGDRGRRDRYWLAGRGRGSRRAGRGGRGAGRDKQAIGIDHLPSRQEGRAFHPVQGVPPALLRFPWRTFP
jgi:hypothetical protein